MIYSLAEESENKTGDRKTSQDGMERRQVRNYLGSNQGAPVRVDRRRLTGQLDVKKGGCRRYCKELLGFKLDLLGRCQMSLTNRQCRER